MKKVILFLILIDVFYSCSPKSPTEAKNTESSIVGTWKLISGTTIENGDTVVTDYTKNVSFIKIINNSHFAFLKHDLNKGKDSTASFGAGGGTYKLADSLYTEHLDYCYGRDWEGNVFEFKVSIRHDTLLQTGIEKVESSKVNRLNIEKYVRVKE